MAEKEPKAQRTSLKAVLSKTELEHKYKVGLMRECQIYGKSLEDSKLYFNSKGYSLSKSQSTELKKELKSSKMAKNWFSKEALFVIEEDHMLSVERIRMMEDRLMEEFEQVSSTSFYNNWDITKPNQKLTRNKNHDADLLIKIIAQFESLQLTKTKMFSCTPMVQEMLEAHRRQEDMENKTAEPEKTEERTWESK